MIGRSPNRRRAKRTRLEMLWADGYLTGMAFCGGGGSWLRRWVRSGVSVSLIWAAIVGSWPEPRARAEDSAAAKSAAHSAGVEVVDRLHAAMVAVMRDAKKLSFDERFARLAPAVDAAYDLEFMGRKSLGAGFDKLAAPEQARWQSVFRSFTVANYAGRFHDYSGQSFQTLGDEASAQETILVRTRLLDPTGENMDLNYRLRNLERGWRIIDVYLKGTVSELALRRSDFTAALEREGFPALLATVEEKTRALAEGKVK